MNRTVDWNAVKERLAKASASLEQSIAVSGERAAEVLEQRARALAQAHQAVDTTPRLRVLAFTVGAESYAIPATHVRGVLRLAELTPLPGAPAHVVGITNVRGEILPLFDLRPLLGRGTQALSDLAQLVIVGREQLELGLVADDARDIVDLPENDILPASLSGPDRDLVRGVTHDAVTILDAEALCRDPRLFITSANGEVNRNAE